MINSSRSLFVPRSYRITGTSSRTSCAHDQAPMHPSAPVIRKRSSFIVRPLADERAKGRAAGQRPSCVLVDGDDLGVELERGAPCSSGPNPESLVPPNGTWTSAPAVWEFTWG